MNIMTFPSERLAKARKAAQTRAGGAWSMFGPDIREALVCRELVVLLSSQDPDGNARLASWSNTAALVLQEQEN